MKRAPEFYHIESQFLKGGFMKITTPILIVITIGLLYGCTLGNRNIDLDIYYTWNESASILTINYTLVNRGVDAEDVVVTFGADLTPGGDNDFSNPEDLSISISAADITRNSSASGTVTSATGGLTVHGVGVIGINLDNPPDED
jgi:hypothetical protein